MKGVTPICGSRVFAGNGKRPVSYAPFDDSSEGWIKACEFIDWYRHEPSYVLGIRSSPSEANKLAREDWDMFLIWYAIQKLLGE